MKTNSFNKNVSALIQHRRNHSHVYMSQAVLARLLGYENAHFISNIERGTAGVPLKKIEQLVKVLNIDPADLKAAIMKDLEAELDYHLNISKHKNSEEGPTSLSDKIQM